MPPKRGGGEEERKEVRKKEGWNNPNKEIPGQLYPYRLLTHPSRILHALFARLPRALWSNSDSGLRSSDPLLDSFTVSRQAVRYLVELQVLLTVVALKPPYLLIYAGSGGPCFD